MQTRISAKYQESLASQEAEAILRSCVHCGFCTATCPTYQLLGDELDGPRGRIYQIKQMLEGGELSRTTQRHLDRCLGCRSCETTCPSGVRYGRLLDIGRELVEERIPRPPLEQLSRFMLRKLVPYPSRFAPLLKGAQLFRPLLPKSLSDKLPAASKAVPKLQPLPRQSRQMLLLDGCVQSHTTPATNRAVRVLLDRFGIELITPPSAGCCGALSHHLSAADEARDFMRRNIDAWWPHIEQGAEAIISSASGCGVQIKEYGYLLRDDAAYAAKAARVSELARDIAEVVNELEFRLTPGTQSSRRIAYHSPCTLQHGQQLAGVVEAILTRAGYELVPVADEHLCCGSAGSYSLLQPTLSRQLRDNKLNALQQGGVKLIASANVGCQLHLASASELPVVHWIELLVSVIPNR